MSQENVEIVRGIWEADRRRDAEAVGAAYAPTWKSGKTTQSFGGTGEPHAARMASRQRGADGTRHSRTFSSSGKSRRHRGRCAGDVSLPRPGRGSGAVVDQAITLLWTLRAGKVVRIRAYPRP